MKVSCRALIIIAVVALATACGQTPADDVDADAMTTAMQGLRLQFDSKPDIPGDAGGDYDARIETASFQLRNLRAIGDAAPGDERTRVAELTIAWTNETQPGLVLFDSAPLGLYSQVSTEIVAYSITGTVKVNDTTYQFQIEDTPPTAIQVMTQLENVTVTAGEITEVTLRVDIEEPVRELNWSLLPPNGSGVIVVDSNSDDIDEVRDELDELLEQED